MAKKKVLIVGGGIAGLTAGCYAARNGYDTVIFEGHSIPGGLCTAWKRKGYTFDISMHMLTGAVSGPFHQMWKELGIIDAFSFHRHHDMCALEASGKRVVLTTDRKEFESRLLELAPQDARQIRRFTRLVFGRDVMDAASLSPAELTGLRGKISTALAMLPAMGTFIRYGDKTVPDLAAEFSDPFVGEAIRRFIDFPGWPMVEFPAAFMKGMVRAGVVDAPAPLGGSQKVMFHMANRFRDAGGELRLNSRVVNLIVENGRVGGLILEDGTRHAADEVVWAGDGRTLIYDILGGEYIDERIATMYRDWTVVKPIVHVMMGVDMDLSGEPHRIILQPDRPISVAGREFDRIGIIHHCFDPSMAPAGKSAVEVWYDTDYDYWEELSGNRPAYEAEKSRIADATISQLDRRWPGFKDAVEVVDVPTPVTYRHYTGNWKGSPDGWYLTADNLRQSEPVRTLPGLEGLQMIGQWTAPFAGTVLSALTGRQVVQLLCRKDDRPFSV